MGQTTEEFRNSLVSFAERVKRVKEHLKNEEATKVALVLPFIALLGYDDRDPTEVAAEHSADFSEKFKRRVDYAILRNGNPVIAIECKGMGVSRKEDRGQLKAYFNACPTVKMGILTDGICYDFFVDSENPNMMDDEPFLEVNFDGLTKEKASDTLVESLLALSKSNFDPEGVSENARKSITHKIFFDYISDQFNEPSVEFTRFLLKESEIKHVRINAIDGYRSIVKSAFNDVFNANVLRKLDISAPVQKNPTKEDAVAPKDEDARKIEEIVLAATANEIAAFEMLRRRIAYLSAGESSLYEAIDQVQYKDYRGKMVVFYKQERKGRLIDIYEGRDGEVKYVISDGVDPAPIARIEDGDERLKVLFRRRVAELGEQRT